MTTDVTEKGLETLIMRHMTGTDGLAAQPNMVAERPPPYGGTGYTAGSPKDIDRAHALDVQQLFAFLRATQPDAFKKLAMADANDAKDINRLKFLARLSGEIGKRGVIDVIINGLPLREIELLREYRTRLVADVVTGKLDVREAALRLPDEAPTNTGEDDADLNADPDASDEEAIVE